MYSKPDWNRTKEHFEAFWNKDYLERCSLAIAIAKKDAPKFQPSRSFSAEDKYMNPQYIHERMEYAADNVDFLYESLNAYGLYFGTGAHCEYFGCVPHYTEETIWHDAILEEPDINLLKFNPQGSFVRQKEVARRLTQLAGNRYLVAMTDNCSNIDCLAALRGTENLLMDMIENPEFVHAARDRIVDVWKKTQTEFLEILKENNEGGSSHNWMHLWDSKRHVQFQCDYSVMISPEMYEEFVLPDLEESAATFEHTTYHLDGIEQLRHLDLILSIKGIDNIQWTRVDGQPKTSVNIEALQKIQRAGKGLVLIPDLDEVEFLMKNLSHKGLHMIINGVKSMEDAVAIEKMARQLAH